MKPTRDLRRLQRSALDRLKRVRSLADRCATGAFAGAEQDAAVTHCVIELYNAWFGFSRCLYLSSAFRARDGSGSRIALGRVRVSGSVDDTLTHAIRRTRPQKARTGSPPWRWADEPSWGAVNVLLNSLDEIGASNLPTVTAGVSTLTPVFDHLPKFRHFYAHRGESTADALVGLLRSYGLPTHLHATSAMLMPAQIIGQARPQPLLLDWIDDVSNSVGLVV
jgi:hypothetical protein